MTRKPELPDFVRDLEILQTLDHLEPPVAPYVADAVDGSAPGNEIENAEGHAQGLKS